jgi:DNA polymerase I-like protein with 3'-5' exonuclease and polymerase domains
MSEKTLLLVDGNALVYRAFHAFPKELTAPDGMSIGATFGFCRILFSAIRTLKPTHLAVAFDLPGGTFRDDFYDKYKANRSAMPEELKAQIPIVHEIVRTMEAPIFALERFEADDMLGTISRTVEKADHDTKVIILSGDQDLLQLVTKQTLVYSPGIAPKKATLFTIEAVQEKYGFSPEQMVDYKALRGDPSDNIPGVKGIGEVTATQLLSQFKTLDGVYSALEKGPLEGVKPGIQAKLSEFKEDAYLSYKLATILTDVPMEFDLGKCLLELQRPENLVEMFRKYNFKSLIEELPTTHKLVATAADIFGSAEEELSAPVPHSESDNIDTALAPVLRKMEEVGVKVDTDYLKELENEYTLEIGKVTEALHEAAGQPSPQQVGFILYDVMKIPTHGISKGKTGFTTNADALNKLSEEYPIAKLLLQYRELTKLQSTYIKPLQEQVDAKSRVHTSYAPDTATGRLSSRNPNLQNIPSRSEQGRRIRRAFTTDKGWKLVAADYSQFELRIAAHLSGDKALIELFNKGGDFHSQTATKMGVDRRTAKIINFSILYGKGAFGFANDLGITMDEAKNYIEQYFQTFSGLRKYLDQVLEETRKNGYGETMFGRRRAFPEITSGHFQRRAAAEREAVNLPIQGSQADILKKAMSNLDKRLMESKSKARLILTVHDELVIEAPDSEVEAITALLKDVMENAIALSVPVLVESKVGTNWADMEKVV